MIDEIGVIVTVELFLLILVGPSKIGGTFKHFSKIILFLFLNFLTIPPEFQTFVFIFAIPLNLGFDSEEENRRTNIFGNLNKLSEGL